MDNKTESNLYKPKLFDSIQDFWHSQNHKDQQIERDKLSRVLRKIVDEEKKKSKAKNDR